MVPIDRLVHPHAILAAVLALIVLLSADARRPTFTSKSRPDIAVVGRIFRFAFVSAGSVTSTVPFMRRKTHVLVRRDLIQRHLTFPLIEFATTDPETFVIITDPVDVVRLDFARDVFDRDLAAVHRLQVQRRLHAEPASSCPLTRINAGLAP